MDPKIAFLAFLRTKYGKHGFLLIFGTFWGGQKVVKNPEKSQILHFRAPGFSELSEKRGKTPQFLGG